ncbi:MAG: hypothetical protein Q8N56_00140 [bacterium]|nr:hypothetical protein [bacterium]
MPLETKRQNRETSQALVRRFGQRVQRSGILMKARKNRFKIRNKSRGAEKRVALRKRELAAEYLRLAKLGKLPVSNKRNRRR